MTSSNTIAFGADALDVDSVKVPGTMLVVRRALLAYEKKMQPGDHLVVCAEEVGKKGRNRVEVAVIHERADAVAAKAAIDRGDDVSAKVQRVAVPPKELVSMCAEIESAEVPQLGRGGAGGRARHGWRTPPPSGGRRDRRRSGSMRWRRRSATRRTSPSTVIALGGGSQAHPPPHAREDGARSD